jgi:hypothetical protein
VQKKQEGCILGGSLSCCGSGKKPLFRSKTIIEKMKEALGYRATGRKIICADDIFELREVLTPYGKANNLDSGNAFDKYKIQ